MEEILNLPAQLNYLQETKSQLRQAIINLGQEITDQNTFRSYVGKINNVESDLINIESLTNNILGKE